MLGLVLMIGTLCRADDRTFVFTYAVAITHLPADKTARIWLPVPQSSEDQQVEQLRQELPANPAVDVEPRLGNRILYLESKPRADGTIPLSISYRITRHEVREEDSSNTDTSAYLQPDALVPIGGKPQTLLADRTLPTDQMKLARLLYDVVDDHMQYRKDKPGWGRGDASWAADSGFGNCTDFHSLFIALARTHGIPCIFEMGFPIPEKHGRGDVTGYHCWAKFRAANHGWIPVDISEANKHPSQRDYFFGTLDANRVAFTTGRDLTLVPTQDGPPLNFFVYPYVEVDSKPVAAENIEKHFAYEDVSPKQ